MSTVDLDAIRKRYERAQQLLSRGGDHPNAVLARAADSVADVPALLAEVERLRATACSALCRDVEDDRDRLRAVVATMREVARSNKRHAATLTAILERVEALTVSTDGDDLDADAEIPVGEIRRALTEPLPHEAASTGGDSTDG